MPNRFETGRILAFSACISSKVSITSSWHNQVLHRWQALAQLRVTLSSMHLYIRFTMANKVYQMHGEIHLSYTRHKRLHQSLVNAHKVILIAKLKKIIKRGNVTKITTFEAVLFTIRKNWLKPCYLVWELGQIRSKWTKYAEKYNLAREAKPKIYPKIDLWIRKLCSNGNPGRRHTPSKDHIASAARRPFKLHITFNTYFKCIS